MEFNTKNKENLGEDIEKHDELNPKLWDGNTLKPEVTEKINQIVDEFLEGLNKDDIAIVVKDIILIGSNCSYNYTKNSDLDIHIIADTSTLDDKDLYDKLYSAYRSLFDKKFEIDFYDIPVEIYVETEGMPRVSNGCYSVMNNEWIKEPVAEDIPELDQEAFDKEFKIWEDRYNKIMADAKEELKEDINNTNKVSNNRGKNMERNFSNFDDAIDALNEINDEEVKEVVDDTEEVEADEKIADNNCIAKTANDVMTAYQNANKWLDSVKESIYIYLNCPFFSSFVHELAHTMPSRFDSFGDILHTVNMEIPYPATVEISKKPATLDEAFIIIFSTLDAIKAALNAFIKCTDEDYHGMSCAAEACLNDIESEYPMLYRLQAKAKECGDDTITFDKFVGQYVEHKGDLLESLKESAKNYTVKLINEDTGKEELKKFDSEEEAIKFYNDKAAKLKKDKNGTITVSFKKYKYNYDEAEQTKPEYRSYNTTEYIK